MLKVDVHDPQSCLSRMLDRVEAGEEVMITRRGKEVARLVPVQPVPRQPGLLRGKVRIGRDFENALPLV